MLTGWRVHLKAKDEHLLTVAACGTSVMPDERDRRLSANRGDVTCDRCNKLINSGKWKQSKRGDWWEPVRSGHGAAGW